MADCRAWRFVWRAASAPSKLRPMAWWLAPQRLMSRSREHAAAAGLTGLEFLSGIPGSIGGAVVMNGGAYGGDTASCLDWADIVTRTGEARRLAAADLVFAYRHSRLPHGAVVVRARLRAEPGTPAMIAARMAEIRAAREASQPIRARTGGSTFRNPPDMKAWELIEAAGCRGLTRGGAQVSREALQFPDQYRRGDRCRYGRSRRGSAPPRSRGHRRHVGMGNSPHRRAGRQAGGSDNDPRRGSVWRHLGGARSQPVHRHAGDRGSAGGRFRRHADRCR